MFASEIGKCRIEGPKSGHLRGHLDEVFVKINGERHYLWRAAALAEWRLLCSA